MGGAAASFSGRDAMGACGALDKGMSVPIRRLSVLQMGTHNMRRDCGYSMLQNAQFIL